MARYRRRSVLLLAGLVLAAAGCNRQDTDCLARIGHKVLDHTQANTNSLRSRLELELKGLSNGPGLKEKVQARISWDSLLTGSKIDVIVNEPEVELSGTVRSEEQRRRAVEIAETTTGVQKVNDALQVRDEAAERGEK